MARHDSKSAQRLSCKILPTASEVTIALNPPMRRDIQDITAGLNCILIFVKHQHERHLDITPRGYATPDDPRALYYEIMETLNLQRDLYAALPGRSVEQDVEFGSKYLEAHKMVMEIAGPVERKEEAREWWNRMDVGVRVERNEETGKPRVLFKIVRK
ncbi:hypothetical protein LTR95_009766 [Oleoguttula sp. CCFEE 5521]